MKRCGKCRKRRRITNFSVTPRTKDKLFCWCKRCCADYQGHRRKHNPKARATYLRALRNGTKWRQNHPKKYRAQWWGAYLKRVYGITAQQHAKILSRQNGVCAICRRPRRKLHVDHKHGSDPIKVRGLLCSPCNTSLGKFQDSSRLLMRAVRYLQGKL